ncbi:hypothetical protein BATDEDRAFT_34299 [Batrachochytrium dendrobatidis JAM81]|uniref:BTB domain-containing protein n=1 Tax=Batrachochytrium dendrobatidis (strain JAM81 / FGSC 10211) TaxID=684364 RepID=F4NUR2_BATDJ|nr:uncharacterized protein BATDEDRAFT_34299 [Batrachochytrium dendrobatidis JAM81]EGF84429.1 hypothetical protein BATDEDRAFT_34299 [Batrachochytrium dendrobatidis JAM81]|eukprot:XP_006675817.1 hypothetical protein BATDEDRAFT_34299 [Batrachochytrium dendrobatidis JAM81]
MLVDQVIDSPASIDESKRKQKNRSTVGVRGGKNSDDRYPSHVSFKNTPLPASLAGSHSASIRYVKPAESATSDPARQRPSNTCHAVVNSPKTTSTDTTIGTPVVAPVANSTPQTTTDTIDTVTKTLPAASTPVLHTAVNELRHKSPIKAESAFSKARSNILLQEYELGRFSDISVVCCGQTFRLHRIVLMQSPFFRGLLLSNLASAIISLRTDTDPRITTNGLEVALRDLYTIHPSFQRKLILTESTAMSVLSAACFLELEDLAEYSVRQIATVMSCTSNIGVLALQLDHLDPLGFAKPTSYGPQHQYTVLLARYHAQLSRFCTASLCRFIGLCSMNDKDAENSCDEDTSADSLNDIGSMTAAVAAEPVSSDNTPMVSATSGAVKQVQRNNTEKVKLHLQSTDLQTSNVEAAISPIVKFLAVLPMSWIKKLIESDWLCVRCDFDRYLITTQIIRIKFNQNQPLTTHGTLHGFESTSFFDFPYTSNTSCQQSSANVFDEIDTSFDLTFEPQAKVKNDEHYVACASKNANKAQENNNKSHPAPVPAVSSVAGLFSSLFDGFLSSKKRKLDSDEELPSKHTSDDSDIEINSKRDSSSVTFDYEVGGKSDAQRDSQAMDTKHRKIKPLKSNRRGNGTRRVSPANTVSSVENQSLIVKEIFEHSITYTYMTFPQLEVVKRDGIVPTNIVLESHWLQAELSNPTSSLKSRSRSSSLVQSSTDMSMPISTISTAGFGQSTNSSHKKLPPFRFGVRFDNIRDQFAAHRHLMTGAAGDSDVSPLMIYSQSVVCAGTQYRLVLSYEFNCTSDLSVSATSNSISGLQANAEAPLNASDATSMQNNVDGVAQYGAKALLQRSRTSTSGVQSSCQSISYRVYAFDHMAPVKLDDIDMFEPITKCDFSGNGHARSLNIDHWENNRFDHTDDGHDSIWLVAVIEF